ncbi:MAG: thioredoxin domain-containing protein [Myxococcaceae bacterium]
MSAAKTETPKLLPVGPVLLVAVSTALCLLALYQWMELVLVLGGGAATCDINATVSCGTVWQSAFATRIHAAIGMPIAGLGLVYGLTCFGLSLVFIHRALKDLSLSPVVAALRLTALLGALSCVTFFVATLRIGAVCPTCLATYALTLAFGVVAAKLLPGPLAFTEADLKPAILWAGGLAIASYLLLLYPGLRTEATKPKLPPAMTAQQTNTQPQTNPQQQPAQGGANNTPLQQFVDGMSPMDKRALGDELNEYRGNLVPPGTNAYPTRFKGGPDTAPIRITDFTDIKCGHCRALEETLEAVRQAVPPGTISVEPRYFPLDGECNSKMKGSPGDGVRCTAAKAEVCLEGTDFYWKARHQMFEEQDTLTKDRVLEIASQGPLNRQQLEACIAKPETQKKIEDDIALALLYSIDGTPLVLVNGRAGSPSGPFLYTMAASGGNLLAPELKPVFATPANP